MSGKCQCIKKGDGKRCTRDVKKDGDSRFCWQHQGCSTISPILGANSNPPIRWVKTSTSVKRQVSPVKRQVSPVKRQVSPVKKQVSPIKKDVLTWEDVKKLVLPEGVYNESEDPEIYEKEIYQEEMAEIRSQNREYGQEVIDFLNKNVIGKNGPFVINTAWLESSRGDPIEDFGAELIDDGLGNEIYDSDLLSIGTKGKPITVKDVRDSILRYHGKVDEEHPYFFGGISMDERSKGQRANMSYEN